jgi:hypothetical protein
MPEGKAKGMRAEAKAKGMGAEAQAKGMETEAKVACFCQTYLAGSYGAEGAISMARHGRVSVVIGIIHLGNCSLTCLRSGATIAMLR